VPLQRSSTGRGTHIYVVDTGVMPTHNDFEGRVIPTLDTSQGTYNECAADDFSCAVDGNGHGTHCAGTAAGKTYGVAKQATIHGVKSVSDNGRGFQSWVYQAFDWISRKAEKPAVISASLQYNGESWGMETAVAAATQAGIAVVVAAGNVNNWACDFSPAYVPEAITVGASDIQDAKAQFSNFGSCNNIWAPGVDITSAYIHTDTNSDTWSGTSMATPHVSGAIALLLEKDPSMSRDKVLAALQTKGLKGVVTGIKPNDPDLLLYVGDVPAQLPAELVHHRTASMATEVEIEDWTIGLKSGTTSAQIEEVCRGACSAVGHPSEGGVAFAEFKGSEMALAALLHGHLEHVAWVEPEIYENALPQDVRTEAGASTASWGLERVGVPLQRSSTGRGTHIYVVDTGVMPTHNDFEGRVIPTLDTSQGTYNECAADDFSCAVDGNGHGTHCAGTAAGKTYGVAKQATIHGVKSVSDNGRGFQSWVYQAFDWISRKAEKPAVISASLQYNGESWGMETAVAAATQAGIAVVVAAGNVNNWACDFSPAYVPEAITVGASDIQDAKAQFSNFGSCNNIWAPGVDITSAYIHTDTNSDTWSGTSMATPHVSGAIALLLEKDPSMSRDKVLAALQTKGLKGVVTGIKPNDPDLLLYVGDE